MAGMCVDPELSAFTESIYNGLPTDFYVPLFSVASDYLRIIGVPEARFRLFRRRISSVAPYQIHDAALMFYQDGSVVWRSLKEPQTLWHHIVHRFVSSEYFERLNSVTKYSTELAALAAARFLAEFARRFVEEMQELARTWNVKGLQGLNRIRDLLAVKNEQVARYIGVNEKATQRVLTDMERRVQDSVEVAARKALDDVMEYREAVEEAKNAIERIIGSGGRGYSHEALSVSSFLRDPDWFRRRVALLKSAHEFMLRFSRMLPTSFSHMQMVFTVGTLTGIDRLMWEIQIRDVVPQELVALAPSLDPDVQRALKIDLLMRMSQRQVMVYQRTVAVEHTIFVDKSGSMDDVLHDTRVGRYIPKISIAAGLALAMHAKYRAEIYLFDTAVEGPVERSRVVDTLLRIKADGGTNITNVLRKILEIGKRDRIYIVITDAIDVVDESVIDELDAADLTRRVRFIVVPPTWEQTKLPWLNRFKHTYVTNVASFEKAVLRYLR